MLQVLSIIIIINPKIQENRSQEIAQVNRLIAMISVS